MTTDSASITFFNKLYDETLTLLVETRNYVLYHDHTDHRQLPPWQRLCVTHESMRITSRLTQVMAWLLAQKAVHAGEMTQAEAAANYALGGEAVCLEAGGEHDETIPAGVRGLLERSRNLYVRVQRLDRMIQDQQAGVA